MALARRTAHDKSKRRGRGAGKDDVMAKKSQKKTPKKHDDEAEDKKLIQKMIDKSCVKKGKKK
jgi:hypothetical protein